METHSAPNGEIDAQIKKQESHAGGITIKNPRASETKRDEAIWRLFSNYIFLTVDQATRILGRDHST